MYSQDKWSRISRIGKTAESRGFHEFPLDHLHARTMLSTDSKGGTRSFRKCARNDAYMQATHTHVVIYLCFMGRMRRGDSVERTETEVRNRTPDSRATRVLRALISAARTHFRQPHIVDKTLLLFRNQTISVLLLSHRPHYIYASCISTS